MALRTDRTSTPLAIVGMACRLPGAANLEEYWRLIVEGKSAVGEVPAERLDQQLYYDPQRGVRGKTYCKRAALLADREFDASRCPVADDLLRSVDNTHLLMTGVAADALRHAGLDPFELPDRNAAVFIGHAQGSARLGELTYRRYLDDALAMLDETDGFGDLPLETQRAIQREVAQQIAIRHPINDEGTRNLSCNMVSGTIAKAFGLTGQWLALNSACASSLHAMLMGARALQRGRVDMVIVGGASDCKSDSLVLFSNAQAMSSTETRPFDADADGLIMSEGYVALVMKTLEKAESDGDPIQAVVRGLGVASDGKGKSLWAPRKEGQAKAMQRAYRSGLDISQIQYLECHATATQLGDATELETLGEVLGPTFPAGKRIPITSIKANIGHALEAAGVAGVIKTVLCIQHKVIPPAINIRSLNPKVNWETAPFYVPLQAGEWTAQPDGRPRRAAVNAFGIGGLNMHVVLDEYTGAAAERTNAPALPRTDETVEDRAVAVVGMSCIFPGAAGLESFWELLASGRDAKSMPDDKRWSQRALAHMASKSIRPMGGFITDYEYDWRKHKVPPKQVAQADPLQFMLLDASAEALSDAGYDPRQMDREGCGVVVGTEFGGDFSDELEMGLRLPEMQQILAQSLQGRGVPAAASSAICADFADVLLKKWPSLIDETGSFTSSTLASRISKTLDLAGGAVSVDSGGTSTMSALAICMDMLLSGDNNLMICAAGQRRMAPTSFDAMSRARLLPANGVPRHILDADYDGVVPGEGVGAFVLKRLSDARRDGDRIHAIIRGCAAAHHASPAEAMRLAVARSCEMAGVHPEEIGFTELDTDEPLHGTAEPVKTLLASHTSAPRAHSLCMGSTTAQLGHLGGAAPMTALIKASLELEKEQLIPNFGLCQPGDVVSSAGQAVQIPTVATALDGRRLGAVASWSKGLAWHLILEHGSLAHHAPQPSQRRSMARPAAASPVPAEANGRSGHGRICRFGATGYEPLQAQVEQALTDLNGSWQTSAKVGFSGQHRLRLAVVADSPLQLQRKLKLASGQLQSIQARQVLEQQGVFCRELPAVRPRLAFAFPGQGAQYEGMLRPLVGESRAAAQELERVDGLMTQLGYPTFVELAWGTPSQLGQDVWVTQVSMLLADAICLAALKDRKITPDVVLGHSYGEFVALYAAGVWDLTTAIRLTRERCDGIVAVATSDAGLLATNAPTDVLRQLINQSSATAYIANVNAPDQTVVGGKVAQLELLSKTLAAESFQARMLPVPAAFHTPLMAGASRLLVQALKDARLNSPQIPVVSTVNNQYVSDVAAVRHNLGAQLTSPVQYAPLISQLASEAPTVFIEVGPQQTLTRLHRRILGPEATTIACDNPKRAGLEPLLCVQALLECLGVQEPVAAAAQKLTDLTTVVTSSTLKASTPKGDSERRPMDDQIPHFDATERRRTKMRIASGGQGFAKSNGRESTASPASPPTPVASVNETAPFSKTPRSMPVHGAPAAGNGAPPTAHVAQPSAVVTAAAPTSQPTATAPASQPTATAPTSQPTATASHDWESFLINFVVEQTGYPPEVVDLDADLEADLGIDSIKKAQLFGELQEYFDVGSLGDSSELSLDDFPTLRHVLNFLQPADSPAATATAAVAPESMDPPNDTPLARAPAAASASVVTAVKNSELESFLVNFVVEQTGYPPEVVELDADLEADLGIDSIKKAQLFGELQEYFDVGSLSESTELSLDDFPTLRHVLDFLASQPNSADPAVVAPTTSVSSPTTALPANTTQQLPAANETSAVSGSDSVHELESFLVNFVVEQTGYPVEVVELDADLEADLGIDSIKKAQLFGELQEYFDVGSLSESTELSLDDFPTLRHVLDFLAGNPPDATITTEAEPQQSSFPAAAPAPAMEIQQDSAPAAVPNDAAELQSFLISFVVEQTGYPAEVVELDADLEADLGIDSIKKAQLFGELQEYFDLGRLSDRSDLSLDDFPTLRHVLDFLVAEANPTSSQGQAPTMGQAPTEERGACGDLGGSAFGSSTTSSSETSLIVLTGTPYQMGWQHGRRFRHQIRANLQRFTECTASEFGELPGQGIASSNPEQVLTADELDELQGLADALEVPLGNIIAHHLAVSADLNSGAHQFAVSARGNQSGRLLHAMQGPLPAMRVLREAVDAQIFVRRPDRGFAHACASMVGTTKLLGGFNSAGVGITLQQPLGSEHAGSATSAIVRGVLETASDLESALQAASALRGSEAWTACISDSKADRVALAEFDGDAFKVRSDEASVAIGQQHGLVAANATTSADTLSSGRPNLTVESAIDQLQSPMSSPSDQLNDTLALVMDAAAATIMLGGTSDQFVTVAPQRLAAELPEVPVRPPTVTTAGHELPSLPANPITTRFSLRMKPLALLANAPAEPAWTGAAVIIGDNRTARTLEKRLVQSGVAVHVLSTDQSIKQMMSRIDQICDQGPAPHLFIAAARDVAPLDADNEQQWSDQTHAAMYLPFFACQKWLQRAATDKWIDQCTLVATLANGGDFGFNVGSEASQSGALAGLLKAIFIEFRVIQGHSIIVKAIDASADAHAEQMADWVFRELASGNLDYEVAYRGTTRSVPFAVEQPASASDEDIATGGNWVVTGGARGITAACALAIGKRHSLNLHLLGTSPRPQIDPSIHSLTEERLQQLKATTMIAARQQGQSAAKAWEALQKQIEIDRTLREFDAAGVRVTYHACDVSDRASVAATLAAIRATAGPIDGILHGAGIDRSCRFEKKQPELVHQTLAAKVDGAANLMALTRTDPIRHFLGFGSISGRLGSFGQADYCLASDMLCKLIGGYRRQRPWIHAVGFHWHPWDEVGMAARPETKSILQGQSQLQLMPAAEGVAHFIRELAAGCPEPEVLVTQREHWQRFAKGLGQLSTGPPAAQNVEATAVMEAPPTAQADEATTHRCLLKMLDAPLNQPANPTFDSAVWILGNGELAGELEQSIQASGTVVRRIPISDDLASVVDHVEGLWADWPSRHLFIVSNREGNAATDARSTAARKYHGITLPFFVAQRWYKLVREHSNPLPATLVAAVSLGGDFGFSGDAELADGGATCGLLKAIHIENSRQDSRAVRCKVIDSPASESNQAIVRAMLLELAADEPEVEVGWFQGRRQVVRPIPQALPTSPAQPLDPRGGTWVVTGGARGITAIAARELARHFGWKLHLLGVSPAPDPAAHWRHYSADQMKSLKTKIAREAVAAGRSPSQAWDRVMKDVEIQNNLQQSLAAGVATTYHECDISDRNAVERTLNEIRRQAGPIRGILHGAGMIDPGRFESKRRGFVDRLIGAKFEGLLNLLEQTQSDPLDYCIGFGSISGRFGGNGLTDYAAGNDAMSKAIDWLGKYRPSCRAATIHWESWEGSGMATLPRYAWGPKTVMNMKYMTPEEGVQRLQQELEAGLPDREVLYTFGDFYPMFYPEEQRPLGEFTPRRRNPTLADLPPGLPLVSNHRTTDNGFVGDLVLNPESEIFLCQHRLRQKPLLPVVVGLESLAEAATALAGQPLSGFRQVQMIDGLRFHTDRPLTAQAHAKWIDERQIACRLTCDFHNRSGVLMQKDRPYLSAIVELGVRHVTRETMSAPPDNWTPFAYPEDAPVYHGPAFRGVTHVQLNEQEGWGRITSMRLADLVGRGRVTGWLVPSCLLDAAFYACGIHLWTHGQGAVSLPKSIGQLQLGRPPREGEQCLAHFVCRQLGERSASYDFTVFGDDGAVLIAAEQYDKVVLRSAAS